MMPQATQHHDVSGWFDARQLHYKFTRRARTRIDWFALRKPPIGFISLARDDWFAGSASMNYTNTHHTHVANVLWVNNCPELPLSFVDAPRIWLNDMDYLLICLLFDYSQNLLRQARSVLCQTRARAFVNRVIHWIRSFIMYTTSMFGYCSTIHMCWTWYVSVHYICNLRRCRGFSCCGLVFLLRICVIWCAVCVCVFFKCVAFCYANRMQLLVLWHLRASNSSPHVQCAQCAKAYKPFVASGEANTQARMKKNAYVLVLCW